MKRYIILILFTVVIGSIGYDCSQQIKQENLRYELSTITIVTDSTYYLFDFNNETGVGINSMIIMQDVDIKFIPGNKSYCTYGLNDTTIIKLELSNNYKIKIQ